MDEVDNLAVMATYGSGTILVQGDHVRVKGVDQFVPDDEETSSSMEEATEAAGSVLGSEIERQPTREYENQASSRSTSTSQQTRSYHSSAIVSQPPADTREAYGLPARRDSEPKRVGLASATSAFLRPMGSSSSASQFPRRKNGERFTSIHPLLCLSLHPHVYIPDYGINGKDAYIENFWRNVNWEQIERRYQDVKAVTNRNSPRNHSPSAFGAHRFPGFLNRPRAENFNIESKDS
jgi:Fe-Mn family superoxide dismutase